MTVRRVLPSVAVAALLLTGCGDDSSPADGPGAPSAAGSARPSAAADALSGPLTVFAAASLTGTFTALGQSFEAAHPGVDVTFNFGPSSGLASSIVEGAPADVLAAASTTTMATVVDAGLADDPQVFARNVMAVVVPADNPAGITTLDQLSDEGVKVALCQAQVPCGTTAARVLTAAGLTVRPVTEEADVKAVLTKVTLGEVDAGIVYVTDAFAAGDEVRTVDVPAAVNAGTDYPLAVLADAPHARTAAAFAELVLSAEGRQVLTEAGFQRP